MNMSSIVDLAGTGATWVLYLLIGLSAFQLALIIERTIVFSRTAAPSWLRDRVKLALGNRNVKAVGTAVAASRSLEAKVVAAGVASAGAGPDAAHEMMHSALLDEKQHLERGLSILGTLGNNAPFIGLFGTVLGVIHSVSNIGQGTGQASQQVMAGISEALISTAVGLLVAIPAVIAFNVFQRAIKRRGNAAEAMGGELIAQLKSPDLAATDVAMKAA